MAVQWFPGHMHLTRQALADRLRGIDVVVELLDARLPGASTNPMLAAITRGKPLLKVLNKQDLADPGRTQLWLDALNAQAHTQAIALDAAERSPTQRLLGAARALAPHRRSIVKPLRLLIVGIPNVGKSTLINTLMGRRVARAADEPGVTRSEQRLLLADDVHLYDTPGVLWPRLIVAKGGYHLAASGAVGRNAFDDVEVALELIDSLRAAAPLALTQRYGLSDAALQAERVSADPRGLPPSPEELTLQALGRACGSLGKGAQVDMQRAAERLLADFRSAALGRITLETPTDWAAWLAEGRALDAERQLRQQTLAQDGHIRAPRGPIDPAAAQAAPARRGPAQRRAPR